MPVWDDFYTVHPYSGMPMYVPEREQNPKALWPGGPVVDLNYLPARKHCDYCCTPLVIDQRERCVNCGAY